MFIIEWALKPAFNFHAFYTYNSDTFKAPFKFVSYFIIDQTGTAQWSLKIDLRLQHVQYCTAFYFGWS